VPALQRERRGACLPPGSHGIEEVRRLIDARASAVREAGHDGKRGAEGHHELAAAFFKRAQVGIFSVEIRREFRGVDFDVRAEDPF